MTSLWFLHHAEVIHPKLKIIVIEISKFSLDNQILLKFLSSVVSLVV